MTLSASSPEGSYCKVVFRDAILSKRFFSRGFSLNGVRVELQFPDMPITRVIVQELPYHMPDGLFQAALFAFGEVKSVNFRWALQRFRTGDRTVAIDLK